MSDVDANRPIGDLAPVETIGNSLVPSLGNTPKRMKTGGRQRGTPNRMTADVRAALRQLAEGNSDRVAEWLDAVAEKDPAEAFRLYLALLRYVVPTLSATAVADISPKPVRQQLAALSDRELLELIIEDPAAVETFRKGMAVPVARPGQYLPNYDPTDEELLK